MDRPIVFQGLVIWHPTEKQIKEEDKQSAIVVNHQFLLVSSKEEADMVLATQIPEEYRKQLKQIQIVVRPF